MSVLAKSIMMATLLAGEAIPALAETDGRVQQYNYAIWVFLGLCALIVVAQVVPMIRSARRNAKIAAELAKKLEQRQLN